MFDLKWKIETEKPAYKQRWLNWTYLRRWSNGLTEA